MTNFLSPKLFTFLLFFCCNYAEVDAIKKTEVKNQPFSDSTSTKLKFTFDKDLSSLIFWDNCGNFYPMPNGESNFDNKLEHLNFRYTSTKTTLFFLLKSNENVEFIDKDGFLIPHGVNLMREKEIRFYESYKKNIDKSVKEEPLFVKSLTNDFYINNPTLREKVFSDEFDKQILFLIEYKKQNNLSSDFYNLWENFFRYKILEKKLFIGKNAIKKISTSYIDELVKSKNTIQNDKYLFLNQYQMAVLNLARLIASKDSRDLNIPLEKRYNVVMENFTGETRDWILMKIIESYYKQVDYYQPEDVAKVIKRFNVDCKTEIYKKYIASYKDIGKIVVTGKLNLRDSNDKTLTLNDLLLTNKGNIIYIDFWASWCAPCIEQMVYSKQLKEKYKDKPVTFIYISTDDNVIIWEKAVNRLSIDKNESYLAEGGSNSEISKYFDVKAIPKYILIGKDGKITNNDAPRPNSKEIIELLNNYIK